MNVSKLIEYVGFTVGVSVARTPISQNINKSEEPLWRLFSLEILMLLEDLGNKSVRKRGATVENQVAIKNIVNAFKGVSRAGPIASVKIAAMVNPSDTTIIGLQGMYYQSLIQI